MAIITLALFSSGHLAEFAVPTWVALAAALAIGLGTWAGGWRIIRTMGKDHPVGTGPRVRGPDGCCVSHTARNGVGAAQSTTQVVSGSVMGAVRRADSARRGGRCSPHRMGVDHTIPASAALAGVAALLVEAGPIAVTLAVLVLGAVVLALLVRQSRHKQPSADFVMGSMNELRPAERSARLNAASERASAVRTVKSR